MNDDWDGRRRATMIKKDHIHAWTIIPSLRFMCVVSRLEEIERVAQYREKLEEVCIESFLEISIAFYISDAWQRFETQKMAIAFDNINVFRLSSTFVLWKRKTSD
jgi:hypothetical protein